MPPAPLAPWAAGWWAWPGGWRGRWRRAAGRRARHEAIAAGRRLIDSADNPLDLADQFRVLDEELARLPDRLRDPVVLCLLQGRTQDEAAAELGRDAILAAGSNGPKGCCVLASNGAASCRR